MWLLGLCIIMSMQSEDKDAKVSTVLAQVHPKELALTKAKPNKLGKMVPPSCHSRPHTNPLHKCCNTQTQFSIDVLGTGYNSSHKGSAP